ncbi:hypothetical protein GCM10010495_15170 [Kitasatospora herbaricolor]|nr:hypothetical protein GCM10010495_15170 [Kitasatospora herbaricolor]
MGERVGGNPSRVRIPYPREQKAQTAERDELQDGSRSRSVPIRLPLGGLEALGHGPVRSWTALPAARCTSPALRAGAMYGEHGHLYGIEESDRDDPGGSP